MPWNRPSTPGHATARLGFIGGHRPFSCDNEGLPAFPKVQSLSEERLGPRLGEVSGTRRVRAQLSEAEGRVLGAREPSLDGSAVSRALDLGESGQTRACVLHLPVNFSVKGYGVLYERFLA